MLRSLLREGGDTGGGVPGGGGRGDTRGVALPRKVGLDDTDLALLLL